MSDDMLDKALPELKRALQALAVPAEAQLGLFPDFVCKADELALDFDQWYRCVVSSGEVVMTDEQRRLLTAVDARLAAMSGSENAMLWTEDALRIHPVWADVRQRASRALAAFGWAMDVPPPSGAVYIPSRQD